MSFWGIVVPETATRTNIVHNPSVEIDASDWWGIAGAIVTRVLLYARFGIASLACTTPGVASNEGAGFPDGTQEMAVAGSTTYTVYVWLRGSGSVKLVVSWYTAAGASISDSTLDTWSLTSTWQKFIGTAVTSPSNAAFAIIRIITPTTQAITFHVDGLNMVALSYALTHIDGDQPGGRWSGLRHASTSLLDPQERSGGREQDLSDDYSIFIADYPGIGMAPIMNNLQPLALQPGSLFQNTKVQQRVFDLHLSLEGATYEGLHSRRKTLIDLIKPDRLRSAQPVTLVYKGSAKKAYIRAHYDGGAEFGNRSGFSERPALRLLSVDPFWKEDNQEVAVLDLQDSVSNSAYVLRRRDGRWQALGTGMNDNVYTIAVDKQRGRIYFGGAFTTANGVTVNRVCYWDGTTFVSMGTGVDAPVWSLAIAPNGDVWVGGEFDNASGTASHGIARWNVSSSTWTRFALGTTSDIFRALTVDRSGVLYAGGDFTNWNGNANSDRIVKYDGSSWSNLGTGTSDQVYALAAHPDGKIYVGGQFVSANGVTVNNICYWNGTTFVAMAGGAGALIRAIAIAHNGHVYVAGDFTGIGGASINRVAMWDGYQFSGLDTGIDSSGYSLAISDDGVLYVTGNFTQAGGFSLSERIAGWNGSSWFHVDVDIPGTPIVNGLAFLGEDFYIGFNTTGSALASGLTTVVNNGTTEVYPIITIVGPSSSWMTLAWIENQFTKERLYFNLAVYPGETITVDLSRGKKSIVSDWRGAITDNPLPNSDFGSFHLLPGSNVIAAYAVGTITAASIQMRWVPQHWGVDGVSA